MIATALWLAGCGHDSDAILDAGVDAGAMADASTETVDRQVPFRLRVVNGCNVAVDLSITGAAKPLFSDIQPGQVTDYVSATIGEALGTLEVRYAGDATSARPLSVSDVLGPVDGARGTVALRGMSCGVAPLWEQFGAAQSGALRLRLVDTLGSSSPTRLYAEQADGSFRQLGAVEPLGDSGPEGIVVPVLAGSGGLVRLEVGQELPSGAGLPGYMVPTTVLRDGATLFVFVRSLALLFVDGDGPVSVPGNGGDVPGTVRINPVVTMLNAVADSCASESSHFAFVDASGRALTAMDVKFGLTGRIALPATSTGHRLTVTPSAGCPNSNASGTVSSTPLATGGRYFNIVYGSTAAGAASPLQLFGLPDRPPPNATGASIVFFNAAQDAPPLDVRRELPDDPDAGFSTVFSAVSFGTISAWVAAPPAAYALEVSSRPAVKAFYSASQSFLTVAVGGWGASAPVAARLVTHSFNGF